VDTWVPDNKKPEKTDATLAEEVEAETWLSTYCAKCGQYTKEDPELRGWWPAINGEPCTGKSDPPVYDNEVLTWYCKRCYIQGEDIGMLRVIREFLA